MNGEADADDWWKQPRRISVVVDNPSWVLPFAERAVEALRRGGDDAVLCRDHNSIQDGAVAFYFGCVHITPPDVLVRNHRNLVVHASDLPKGRGFSPLTWLTLSDQKDIPVCLIEADLEVDSGDVVYRDCIRFEGHELLDEMQRAMGEKHIELALRYLRSPTPPRGQSQEGEATYFPRRTPKDSKLDVHQTIAEQFNLLRTVDNDKYPAFFELNGHVYKLAITKAQDGENDV